MSEVAELLRDLNFENGFSLCIISDESECLSPIMLKLLHCLSTTQKSKVLFCSDQTADYYHARLIKIGLTIDSSYHFHDFLNSRGRDDQVFGAKYE